MGAISKKESIGAKFATVVFSFKTLGSLESFLNSFLSKFVSFGMKFSPTNVSLAG